VWDDGLGGEVNNPLVVKSEREGFEKEEGGLGAQRSRETRKVNWGGGGGVVPSTKRDGPGLEEKGPLGRITNKKPKEQGGGEIDAMKRERRVKVLRP